MASQNEGPKKALEAVLVKAEKLPDNTPIVKGYDFNQGINFDALLEAYKYSGFQASHFGDAVDEINKMIHWRLSDDTITDDDDIKDPEERKKVQCKIFLGLTSNMISSGTREIIRFLVQHKMVDYIVTTGGGIEEDLMKCMAPHYMGSFRLDGATLRKKGINRIGNLLVPNDNYCSFEDWVTPILTAMHDEQEKVASDNPGPEVYRVTFDASGCARTPLQPQGEIWSPSKMIRRFGKEINNEESVWYWAYKNDIPVFCPAITDGSVGDMVFFASYNRPGFIIDIVQDIRALNDAAMHARKSGMVILGGGLVKHHICNANLMRNGADFAVFVNTGQEFDGSDSGARPDEARSWGKVTLESTPVKVYGDATLIFPLLVARTFARYKDVATKIGKDT